MRREKSAAIYMHDVTLDFSLRCSMKLFLASDGFVRNDEWKWDSRLRGNDGKSVYSM
jgi:hypothetical protein